MKGRKSVKISAAALACVLALSSSGFQALATELPVQVNSTSQTQMQSKAETIYVNNVSNLTQRSQNFDDNWKFNLGDVRGAQAKGFDDSKWDTISVPHDYSIIQDYQQTLEAESGYLPGGTGWYRKYFTISPDMEGKRIRLDFDGVYMNATVYVNGKELGKHPFGYTPFSFDITDEVKVGEENVIAVKVDHQTPSSRWYSGSGIYRSVHMTVTDPVHVDLYGQEIDTPNIESQLKGQNVTMKVNTTVANDSSEVAKVTLKHTVYEKGNDKNVIASKEVEAKDIAKGKTEKIESTFDTTSAPKLWGLENPSLYIVKTEVKVGDKVVDTIEDEFGFRHFKMDKDKGAYLNGQPIKLKGVCMHHDQGSLGSAAYRRAIERQVEILQEMGTNSIRVTHNPAAEVLIDVCNEKGMLVIDELFDGWMHAKNGNKNDYSVWFNKAIGEGNEIIGGASAMTWAEFDLKATLRRGQNAPSIVMWSLGNEIQEGANGGGYADKAKELIKWAKEVDDSRMLTIGSNDVKNGGPDHVNIGNQLTQVGGSSGTNYSKGNSYDELHKKYPDWKLYGSETASAINSRGIYTTKKSGGNAVANLDKNKQLTSYDKSKVPWGAFASEAWYDVIQRDFVAGEYVWTGFDYIGEPTPANGISGGAQGEWTSPKNSYFGIIDTAGFPKDSYYFYQSQWNDNVNTLHILPTWNENTVLKEKDNKVEVVVYSDAKEVELVFTSKDGKEQSLGSKKFETVQSDGGMYSYQRVEGSNDHTGLYMTFEVPFKEGTLKAIAKDKDGKVISDTKGRNSVTTTGKATKLEAKADRDKIAADGKDLTYVEVDVKDAKGNIVPDAADRVTFAVEGDGVLVGVDNGSSPDHDSYKADNRRAHAGKVLAIVKSTKKAGKFTVTASAKGLESSQVSITTTPIAGQTTGKQVVSYEISRNFYVKNGAKPLLPKKVELTYNDGTKEQKEVDWDAISEEQLNGKDAFQVKGVAGDIIVVVNVTMISNVAAVMNYSTVVPVGQTLKDFNLPTMRPAVLDDGTILNASFDVAWDKIPDDAFEKEGTVEIKGKSNVFGQNKEVKALVRVQKEQISVGENIGPKAARLSQDIDQAYQSDTLAAIIDGNKKFETGKSPNPTCWSNYKNSQPENGKDAGKNDKDAKLRLEYDTQQRIAQIKITFCRDNWSARYPKAGVTEIYVDNKKVEVTKETIPEEVNQKNVAGVTYTYDFAPILATDIDVIVKNVPINENDPTGQQGVNPCTAISEVEILKANGSFTTGQTAELNSLTLNGKELSADQLASGKVSTPALVANIENITTKDNASVTVLPEYNKVVKLILESEDHKVVNTFVIELDKEASVTPGDSSNDVKIENSWIIAGNAQPGDDNKKENVNDGKPETMWHTKWNYESKEEERWVGYKFPEAKTLDGMRYLPRQTGGENGRVTEYKVEYRTSDDGEWKVVPFLSAEGKPVNTATISKDHADWVGITFAEPIEAKQIRLVGVHTYADSGNDNYMSCAELRVTAPKQTTDISKFKAAFDPELKDGKVIVSVIGEKGVCPAVVVKNAEGKPLQWGIDYKVTYENNKEFGTAKAIVEGIIDYSGKIELPFVIEKAELTLENIFAVDGYKNQYTEGDSFDPTGLKLTLVYNDQTSQEVVYSAENASQFSFEPGLDAKLATTDKKVIVTYEGKSVELPITVSKVEKPDPEPTPNPDPKPDPTPGGSDQGGSTPGGSGQNGSALSGSHNGNGSNQAVQTGDNSSLVFPVVGVIAAIVLIGIVVYIGKRKK